jgi:signal transduction histidine kinase
MTDTTDASTVAPSDAGDAGLLDRLAAHKTLGKAPRCELEWLIAHGTLARCQPGEMIARKGEPVEAMYVILSGQVSHLTDQGGTWRKVMTWRGGEVAGNLPYSRLATAPGNSVVEEVTEMLRVDRAQLSELPAPCPHLAELLVHVMLDRARTFKASDLQAEKLASLGKLAAGLAHELNNPASAAARSAQLVSEALTESDEAARALGAAHLDADELALLDRVRGACLAAPTTSVLSPLERSDREEAIVDWLAEHDADESFAAALADTGITLDLLRELAQGISGEKLQATLGWLAAGCSVRALARDIERAASRVHALVSAVKGFTYMDHATAPEPVDLAKGLTDTIAVLAGKARGKSASLTVDVPADLPRVRGFGGELNQVWLNLVDNALDAIPEGGRVSASARLEGAKVVVRVIDDGGGIPESVKSRIFDPFFTTKQVGKGTGLGLDIARRLLDRNDGLIEVDSRPGRTEFRVSLPAIS